MYSPMYLDSIIFSKWTWSSRYLKVLWMFICNSLDMFMITVFFLTNFSEVERQLNNKPATTPQLPSKKQRNGSSSSVKHQHQTSDPTLSSSPRTFEANKSLDESQPMLSTFGGRSSQQPTPTSDLLTPGSQGLLSTKSTVVQLRRNTNKLGRQAPTPPKRTRYVFLLTHILFKSLNSFFRRVQGNC